MIKLMVIFVVVDWIKEIFKLVVGNGVNFYLDLDNYYLVIYGLY